MTVSGKQILALACQELGYHEGSGKDNKYGRWYGMNYAAWCMMFCQYIYDKAGAKLPYRTASCSALLSWYKAKQPECIVKTPIPGSLVIFDLPKTAVLTDHVGLFESIDGQYITTIDGNTSSQNDANGGYVNRRIRRKNLVHAYIKPRELVEMTDKEVYEAFMRHAATLPVPEWAGKELQAAKAAGITDGSNPTLPTTRYETAIMINRKK